jgi:hypothetical protein
MPGPPVRRIITTDDPGFSNEVKVKGTYLDPASQKYIFSKFLFISAEEEALFFKNNPKFSGEYVDEDEGPPPNQQKIPAAVRGKKLPHKTKNQAAKGFLAKG